MTHKSRLTRQAATWSAALRFAPTIRKKPTSAPTKAVPSAFSKAFASADESVGAAVKTPRIVGNAKPALPNSSNATVSNVSVPTAAVQTAPAMASTTLRAITVHQPTNSSGQTTTTAATSARRVLAKPPPMTLDDDDINGFKQTTQGKRLENRKSRSKKGKRKDDPALQYGDVPYDPARPCDYVSVAQYCRPRVPASVRRDPSPRGFEKLTLHLHLQSAFKAHLQALRTQRRIEREEARRRARSGSESSYYSQSEPEESDTESRSTPSPFDRGAAFHSDLFVLTVDKLQRSRRPASSLLLLPTMRRRQ